MRNCHGVECQRPPLTLTPKRHDGMGLPGRKDIKIPRHRQHVLGHSRTKRLDMPVLGAMKTELAIKTIAIDLGGTFRKITPEKLPPWVWIGL